MDSSPNVGNIQGLGTLIIDIFKNPFIFDEVIDKSYEQSKQIAM